jgi:hypothetical protein
MESKGTFFFLFFSFWWRSSQLNFVVVVKIHEEIEKKKKKGAPREGPRMTLCDGLFDATRPTMDARAGVRSFFGALLFFRRDDLPTMIIRKILYDHNFEVF